MSSHDKLSRHDKSLFVAHHVGGRGGGVSFPHLPMFSDDILQIIYDADENCIEHIRESFPNSNARVIPYCMAETSGEAHFNINYDPYSSSLYLFNPLFAQSYQWDGSSDYVYGRTFRTQRTVTMTSYSIDALIERNEVPAPDFLSIDTQGSELPILRGAVNSLATDTIAVCCEINFCEHTMELVYLVSLINSSEAVVFYWPILHHFVLATNDYPCPSEEGAYHFRERLYT